MLRIAHLKMEYENELVGVERLPWFGWIIESDRKNVIQDSFLLEIAADSEFTNNIYESGWVESQESAHVTCAETPLVSCTRYYVRVRIKAGEETSDYSHTVSFVTAVLTRKEWKAEFVSAESPEEKDKSSGSCLRREINVSGEIENAFVCTTALGLYHFYINGKKVGMDEMTPGWTSYHKHLCYQTYEVTNLLRKGTNTLGAMVGAGWYKGKMGFLHLRNNYGEQTAFLMQMVVRYRDGAEECFCTDGEWMSSGSPVTFSEIYDGETYDAGLEIQGWSENGLPMEGWHPVSRISFPFEALTAQAAGKVTLMDELPALEARKTPQGDTILDFGQNLTGWVSFQVKGRKGAAARLKCFETLDAAGNVYTANLRDAKQEITYICKDEEEADYHPRFTFQGFRYIQILEWPCPVKAEDFTAYTLHTKMEQTGTFQCSQPLVNKLQHNILWGLKGNFLDIPTDCPQRDERMGWTGDAQIFCRTSCYLMNTYTFFRKWLKDVACDQTPEGGVPHVVPDIISGKEENDWLLSKGTHSAAAWADVAVINPWTMYLTFGDKTILEEQYESMQKWIDFMRAHARDDIWNYRLQFGDWVALDAEEGSYFGATPNDLTCTAYYAYSTGLFANIAGILGKSHDEQEYRALYNRIVHKFRTTFFNPDGTMTAMTQTAHIIALYFGLVPEAYKDLTAKNLIRLLEKENGHLVTGFVGTPYFCHALSQNGYTDEAYQLLLKEDFPSWLYQVKMGATTVWEHWDGLKPDGSMWSPDMNSFNHYAYGAVGDWLYRVVLGIEADPQDPGYHRTVISPQTGKELTFAEGTYESVYGKIAVRWDKSRTGEVLLKIQIPHNTTAAVLLERSAGQPAGDGLIFEINNGVWQTKCGSGSWEITYHTEK